MNLLTLDDLIIKNNAQAAICTGVYSDLPIFPVNGKYNSNRYKAPLTSNGFKDATTKQDVIERWWLDHPDAMIGMATGKESGIYVIDIDTKNGIDGYESLKTLQEELGQLPNTFSVKTISGGGHLYFRVPDGVAIPSSANAKTAIDFRGNGGYIVYADSTNSEGKRYEVINNVALAELPQEYIQYFQKSKPKDKVILENGMIGEGGRNVNMTAIIGKFLGMGIEGDKLKLLAYNLNAEICSPPLDNWEIDNILESIGKKDRGYSHNPIGNGQRFADRHGNNVKCINGRGNAKIWMVWNGSRWIEDELGLTSELAKQVAIDLQIEAEHLPKETDESIRKSLYALSKKTQDNPHKILAMACSDPKIAIKADAFDSHDYIAACLNGVIDLNTGEFFDHKPELLYRKQLNANFNPDATSEKWNNFIGFFTDYDKEVENFFARLYGGLGLIGGNPEQKMLLLLGRGSNGKSSLNEIMRGLLSDYSDTLRKEVLCSKTQKDYRHDLADLKNARFITVTEPMQDFEMNGAFIKEITGGDTIKGRQNYSDSETFKCKGLISLASNWEPSLYNGDEGLERRFIVYRHNAVISEAQKDPNLVQKICEESDAVLAWLYRGRMEYLKNVKLKEQGYLDNALNPPQVIQDMTEDFINRQDPFKAFIQAACIEGQDCKTQAEPFFNAFSNYCLVNGEKHPSQKRFYEIASNKFSRTMINGCVHYLGVTIKK